MTLHAEWNWMRRAIAFALVALCFLPQSHAQGSDRRDGNWWIAQSRPTKGDYIVGFFDGMDLGEDFATWRLNENMKDKRSSGDATVAALESYGWYVNRYFANVKNGQIVDGLDVFYGDYKNRTIRTHFAVWLVVQTIAGEPPKEEVLNAWRKYGR